MSDPLDTARKVGGGLVVSGGFLAAFVPYAMIMLILGAFLLLAAYGLKLGKASQRPWMGAIGAIISIVAVIAMVMPEGIITSTPPEQPAGAEWEITVPATVQGGGRDAATEVFNDGSPTDFASDCTAGGAGTSTLDASTTNMFVDRTAQTITIQYTVDDDAAYTVAGFSAPDCHANDFYGRPKNPIDVNNDGSADNQMLWARISSISRTTVMDNVSHTPAPMEVFYYTSSSATKEGFYLAWMLEDADQAGSGAVASACPASKGKTSLSVSDCNQWVYIGDTTSTGFYFGFFFLVNGAYPFWGYENGAIGDHEVLTVEFGHGAGSSVKVDSTWTYWLTLIVRT